MNVLICLAFILFLLMLLIGHGKGVRSFLSLFFNLALLFLFVYFVAVGFNSIVLALLTGILASMINLFYINGWNDKTIVAFFSSILIISVLLVFIIYCVNQAKIQGFSEEEIEELSIFSFYIGVNYVHLASGIIILGTIGAINDTALSIASYMQEFAEHHPTIQGKEYYLSGIKIGHDILGTTTNTLFFAFLGSYLGLVIWFKDLHYSLSDILNSKVFNSELIALLFSGMGVLLVIPLTAYLVMKRQKK